MAAAAAAARPPPEHLRRLLAILNRTDGRATEELDAELSPHQRARLYRVVAALWRVLQVSSKAEEQIRTIASNWADDQMMSRRPMRREDAEAAVFAAVRTGNLQGITEALTMIVKTIPTVQRARMLIALRPLERELHRFGMRDAPPRSGLRPRKSRGR